MLVKDSLLCAHPDSCDSLNKQKTTLLFKKMKPRISKWLIKAKWLIDNIVLIIIIIIVEALLLAWLKDSDRRGIVRPFCLHCFNPEGKSVCARAENTGGYDSAPSSPAP